jgi:hypothetical protein
VDAPYRSGPSKAWELSSIDVMRLDRTLGQSHHCLRIKLYVDENFP